MIHYSNTRIKCTSCVNVKCDKHCRCMCHIEDYKLELEEREFDGILGDVQNHIKNCSCPYCSESNS